MKFKVLRVQTMGNQEYNQKLISHFSEQGVDFAIIGGAVYADTPNYLDESVGSDFEGFGPMMSIFKFDTEEWNNGATWEYIFEERGYISNFYTLCEIIADRRVKGEMIFYRRTSKTTDEPMIGIADYFKARTSITK